MELVHVLAILLFFLHCELSVLSHPFITGTFRVLHQHPGIKSCAGAILQQNNLLGGRVSNVTGVCEGLSYSWGLNQTIESGYAYVKKISVQQKYQPPVTVEYPKNITWRIPGILTSKSKVDITFAVQSNVPVYLLPRFSIDFQSIYSGIPCSKGDDCHRIRFTIWDSLRAQDTMRTMELREIHAGQVVNVAGPVELKLQQQRKYFKMKFTFQVQTDVFKFCCKEYSENPNASTFTNTTEAICLKVSQMKYLDGKMAIINIERTSSVSHNPLSLYQCNGKFLLDGRNMITFPLQTLDPKTLKYFYAIAYSQNKEADVQLHDFVFTEE